LLVLGLLDRKPPSSLLLFACEAAFAFDLWQQVAFVGDLVEDVVEEVEQALRGKWPRRRRGDERLPAGCG
jgi:hypothetical protein